MKGILPRLAELRFRHSRGALRHAGSVQSLKSKFLSIAFAVLRQKRHIQFVLPDHDEAMEAEIEEAIAHSLALSRFKFSLKPKQFSCLSASLRGESVVTMLPTAFAKLLN